MNFGHKRLGKINGWEGAKKQVFENLREGGREGILRWRTAVRPIINLPHPEPRIIIISFPPTLPLILLRIFPCKEPPWYVRVDFYPTFPWEGGRSGQTSLSLFSNNNNSEIIMTLEDALKEEGGDIFSSLPVMDALHQAAQKQTLLIVFVQGKMFKIVFVGVSDFS